MKRSREELPDSIAILKNNIDSILTVNEWAQYVGYTQVRRFSDEFRNHYGVRPVKILISFRLSKIIFLLTEHAHLSCYEVALKVGLQSEKHLYNFTRRHLDLSPNSIRELSDSECEELLNELPNLDGKIR